MIARLGTVTSMAPPGSTFEDVVARLSAAGCVDPEGEAAQLLAVAADPLELAAMLARRTAGEPLEWIVGATTFCGRRVVVHAGVYVPRPHSEALVRQAIDALPAEGIAYDVCTGSGAIAAAIASARPDATVIGLDLDPRAVACARSNGIDAHQSDLLGQACVDHVGEADLVVGVVPYVPTEALVLLPRDVGEHEDLGHYDGGAEGTVLLRRLASEATRVLRPGGSLLVELGGNQDEALVPHLHDLGYVGVETDRDEEGDLRSLSARWRPDHR